MPDYSMAPIHEVEFDPDAEEAVFDKDWSDPGQAVRWECQRCGTCCRSDWRINITWPEYDRLKDKMDDWHVVKNPNEGTSHPFFETGDRCFFFDCFSKECMVYEARPYTCAAFPFALHRSRGLLRYDKCPGFGFGPVIDIEAKQRELAELMEKAKEPFVPESKKKKGRYGLSW